MYSENKALNNLVLEAFSTIGEHGALLTAGTEASFNVMTIGWGSLGFIWRKNIVSVLVRPTRHTFQFMERDAVFTVSFYREQYKKALAVCGSKSGRDTDKVAAAALTPFFLDGGVSFKEAYLTVLCRTVCKQALRQEEFMDASLPQGLYPNKDYHVVYYGELLRLDAPGVN